MQAERQSQFEVIQDELDRFEQKLSEEEDLNAE